MTDAEIAELRRVAENQLVRPSERVEARRKLVEMGAIPGRRLFGDDKRRALYAARDMLREMGFE
ncbi:MAG: hypothetical protein B7X09_03945 [Acidiphilium sp. 21-66-27]|uniref:hypothetical protein n=1 Tax=Acidiphilium sp. 20-67-58 TaxID=1970291 RepID=UPI000BD0041A|nr:hypothetical protein [Acidiphilium sp. 20-67-58]OYV54202.1 MAG: hypothetical protein B7Z76_15350 [Acidiphilium sp. 20-67-58]OYV66312.1 MAG: hypothetical protein B7X09_03945 [Acidiphilium sp. 21-66-27]